MIERKIFNNLKVEDYIHPLDKGTILQSAQLSIVDKFSDLAVKLAKQIVLGRYVELNKENSPRIFEILSDVCCILNYSKKIRLFVTHEYSVNFMQIGDQVGYVLMNDLVLNDADDDMLYFLLGNSVGMFKGGHIRLITVTSVICNIPALLPYELILKSKQRYADLSSDRAGLLACQNYAAAIRCMLWDVGFPSIVLKKLSDRQVINIGETYEQEISCLRAGVLSNGFSEWKKMKTVVAPIYMRLNEIRDWYYGDYSHFINE